MLNEKGMYSKYTIIRNSTGEEVNAFVLDPMKDTVAREALTYYANHIKDRDLAEDLLDWLSHFSDKRCIYNRVCPYTGTPICCCSCPRLSLCEFDDNLCDRVRYEGIENRKHCVKEVENG